MKTEEKEVPLFTKEDVIRFGKMIYGTNSILMGGSEGIPSMFEMVFYNKETGKVWQDDMEKNILERKCRAKDKFEKIIYSLVCDKLIPPLEFYNEEREGDKS